MKTLYLEKRGMNFHSFDPICKDSDVGNYRVCTPGYDIQGKDGKKYFMEVCRCNKARYRTENMRTGKPLKHPKYEVIAVNAAAVDLCYIDDAGNCWKDADVCRRLFETPRKYTLANILDIVNEISADHYDAIEFI